MSTPLDLPGVIYTTGQKLVAALTLPSGLTTPAGLTVSGGTVSGTTTITTASTQIFVGLTESPAGSGQYSVTADIAGALLPDTTTRPYTIECRVVASGTDMTTYSAIASAFGAATNVAYTLSPYPYCGGFVRGGQWGYDVGGKLLGNGSSTPQAVAAQVDLWEFKGAGITPVNGINVLPGTVVATYIPPATGTVPNGSTPAFQGKSISLVVNYPWAKPFSLTNYDATGWSEIVFMVKANEGDPDTSAVIAVKLSNPPAAGDGLFLINGAAPSGSTSATDGFIEDVTIVTASRSGPAQTSFSVGLSALGTAIPAAGYVWEAAFFKAGIKEPFLGTGILSATQSAIASAGQL